MFVHNFTITKIAVGFTYDGKRRDFEIAPLATTEIDDELIYYAYDKGFLKKYFLSGDIKESAKKNTYQNLNYICGTQEIKEVKWLNKASYAAYVFKNTPAINADERKNDNSLSATTTTKKNRRKKEN